jgi:hypothetical protein
MEAPLVVGTQERHVGLVAPPLTGEPLFPDGQTLGEPARHAVLGHAEMKGVRELVPQGRAPVELADPSGRGGVHGQDAPKAHPEYADARQSGRPHGEVGVARVELEPHRGGWLVAVAFHQLRVGLLSQRRCVRLEQVRLVVSQEDREVLGPHRHVPVVRVQQIQRVLVPDVERIPGERLLKSFPRLLDATEPQQVDAKDPQASPRPGVHGHRLPSQLHGLGIPPLIYRELRDGIEQLGVARIQLERLGTHVLEPARIARQVMGGRQHRAGLQRGRVDVEGSLRSLPGVVVAFGAQMQARQEDEAWDVVRVHLEGLLHGLPHAGLTVEPEQTRQAHEGVRMIRVHRQHVPEGGTRVGTVVLLQKQLSGQDAGLVVPGVGGHRLVVRPERVPEEVRIVGTQVSDRRRHGGEIPGATGETVVVQIDEGVEFGHGLGVPASPPVEDGSVEPRGNGVRRPALDGGREGGFGGVELPLSLERAAQRRLHLGAVPPHTVPRGFLRVVVAANGHQRAHQADVMVGRSAFRTDQAPVGGNGPVVLSRAEGFESLVRCLGGTGGVARGGNQHGRQAQAPQPARSRDPPTGTHGRPSNSRIRRLRSPISTSRSSRRRSYSSGASVSSTARSSRTRLSRLSRCW